MNSASPDWCAGTNAIGVVLAFALPRGRKSLNIPARSKVIG